MTLEELAASQESDIIEAIILDVHVDDEESPRHKGRTRGAFLEMTGQYCMHHLTDTCIDLNHASAWCERCKDEMHEYGVEFGM